MTPFDRVKNQLIAKIKEVHIPDQATVAGVVNKLSKLDFTGAAEEDEVPTKKKRGEDEEEEEQPKPKKQAMPDFT